MRPSGFVVGLLLGRNQGLARLLDPILIAMNSLPKVALAPLFIMWFGIGIGMKMILTATIVFFLVFINTYNGVRNVDPELVEILRLMGAKEHHIVTKVIVPSALQWVFAGYSCPFHMPSSARSSGRSWLRIAASDICCRMLPDNWILAGCSLPC